MSFNGSGTFTALSTFTSGTTISSTAMNALIADIASGLSNVICKDGQATATGQIKSASGTVAAPGLSFGSDADCGLYRIGADNIGFAAGGAKVLDISATGLGVTGTTLSGDGTVSLPGIGFSGDTDTGLYRIGANNIGVAAAGAKVLDVSATGLGVTGTTLSGDGTVSLPGIGFSGDTDCGFYRIGANNFAIAAGGTKVADINATRMADANGNAYTAFPSGTAMLFVQTSAPTGWTKVTSTNNAALRLVSGSASTGGTANFTDAFTSRTIARANLPNENLSLASLTGTTSHSNMLRLIGGTTAVSTTGATLQVYAAAAQELQQPTVTFGGSIPIGGSGTAMDFAVKYVDVIHATKD